MTKNKLNTKLFEICTSEPVDYDEAENLLKLGAEPLGEVESYGGLSDNLYGKLVSWFQYRDGPCEDLYKVTELFLKYGMDIASPAVPYDDDEAVHPLCWFAYGTDEVVLKTLKLLLDHGLRAEDAAQCWLKEIADYVDVYGDLDDSESLEGFYGYLKKLMLFASYPHVLNADESLRREIWYDVNDYDVSRFRDCDGYNYNVDFVLCNKRPEVYRSIVTATEKATGKSVWKFGVCLTPDEAAAALQKNGIKAEISDKNLK